MSIERSEKVATPSEPELVTVVVPLSVPAEGFVPIASVTAWLQVVPPPEVVWIATLTAGVIAEPAVVFEGWTVKASCFALEQLAARATGACTNGRERRSDTRLSRISPLRAIGRINGGPPHD